MRYRSWLAAVVAGGTMLASGVGAVTAVAPADSELARAQDGRHLHLVSPLSSSAGVQVAGWKMGRLEVAAVSDPQPWLGARALRFAGVADSAGAKGDFTVAGGVPGEVGRLGFWAHVAEDANVDRLGLQVVDAEGEQFLLTRPVAWRDWGWVEIDLTVSDPAQAWKQADKNGRIDMPLSSVHVAWFSRAAGPSAVTVNALVASTSHAAGQRPVLAAATEMEPGEPLHLPMVIGNPAERMRQAVVEFELQRDPRLATVALPDPVRGADHAAGAESWTEHDGEEIERGSLTDPEPRTSARLPWGGGYTEAFQYIDLGEPRRITHLTYESGDANWAWRMDVAGSLDGETWTDAPGLQDLDAHKKWGHQSIEVRQPFEARYLRLRHHNDGEGVNSIAMPSRLSVFDGAADETWALPQVGPVVASGRMSVEIGPRGFEAITLGDGEPLATGAYLLAVRVQSGDRVDLIAERLFVMPEPLTPEQQAAASVGLNSSQASMAPLHRRLGIGWVRFENLKWRMASPEPDRFVFDGLKPWMVDHDGYLQAMAEEHIQVLPYLFLCPEWASSAPADAKHRAAWPPSDFDQYADFVFQTVARYGNQSHDPSVLKTEDKRSGLGLLSVYELWNEPNLNDPGWGHWVGPIEQYYELFRVGAEAAKRADPTAKILNGGYAGITVGLVDQLRSYTYDDGKRPLDFVDILSVHTYTGANAPERSVVDTNVDRSGNTQGAVTHEEHLRRLGAWRDQHKPGMPIWMTETGYDTGGPRAVTDAQQAAYNVRNTLMMRANGVDKVLIYREVGSAEGLYAASGLIRDDQSFKPSWFAVATLIRQLDGAERIRRLPHPDSEVYLYAWELDGGWTVAAWSIGGETPLGLSWGSAERIDAFGGRDEVADAAAVMLSGMPVYLTRIGDAAAVEALAAEADAQHERWRRERQQLAEATAYLFDFGSTEHVGSADIGGPRRFTPVLANDAYTADRGYGFENGLAERNDDAHWIKSPTQRDSCRVSPGNVFRIDADPGAYRLTVRFTPASQQGGLQLETGRGEPRTLRFTRDEPEVNVDVQIGDEPMRLQFQDFGGVSFVTLVAQ